MAIVIRHAECSAGLLICLAKWLGHAWKDFKAYFHTWRHIAFSNCSFVPMKTSHSISHFCLIPKLSNPAAQITIQTKDLLTIKVLYFLNLSNTAPVPQQTSYNFLLRTLSYFSITTLALSLCDTISLLTRSIVYSPAVCMNNSAFQTNSHCGRHHQLQMIGLPEAITIICCSGLTILSVHSRLLTPGLSRSPTKDNPFSAFNSRTGLGASRSSS